MIDLMDVRTYRMSGFFHMPSDAALSLGATEQKTSQVALPSILQDQISSVVLPPKDQASPKSEALESKKMKH